MRKDRKNGTELSMERRQRVGNPDKLEGWAQIECYLGISRNTILARSYPIRKDGGVFAYKPELDNHGKSKPAKKAL